MEFILTKIENNILTKEFESFADHQLDTMSLSPGESYEIAHNEDRWTKSATSIDDNKDYLPEHISTMIELANKHSFITAIKFGFGTRFSNTLVQKLTSLLDSNSNIETVTFDNPINLNLQPDKENPEKELPELIKAFGHGSVKHLNLHECSIDCDTISSVFDAIAKTNIEHITFNANHIDIDAQDTILNELKKNQKIKTCIIGDQDLEEYNSDNENGIDYQPHLTTVDGLQDKIDNFLKDRAPSTKRTREEDSDSVNQMEVDVPNSKSQKNMDESLGVKNPYNYRAPKVHKPKVQPSFASEDTESQPDTDHESEDSTQAMTQIVENGSPTQHMGECVSSQSDSSQE